MLRKNMRAPIVLAPSASAYPICGLSFILVHKRQRIRAKAHQLRRFLRWASGAGQGFAAPLLFAPLPTSMRRRNEQIINTIL
jgi:ABC-type phosphate transport system substrate-binding protein